MTREEAIRDIKECVMPYVGGISLQMAIDDMTEMDRLSKATPVLKEPERPHGEWIDEGFYAENVGKHVYACTHCNEHIVEYPSEMGSYCKYCGSDNRPKEGDKE